MVCWSEAELVDDQAEEAGAANADIVPAQMLTTMLAQGVLPGITREPRVIESRISRDHTTQRSREAGDIKGNTDGIDKAVQVRRLHVDLFAARGDGMLAGSTADQWPRLALHFFIE